MRGLLSAVRSIKPQIVAAYGALAVVILMIVAGAVLGSRAYVLANTIDIGELHTESRTVDGAGATAVDAVIVSGVGQLNIRGGATDLLELEFVSNVPEMQPFVLYDATGKRGDLFVSPSVPSGIPDPARFSEYQNEWDVRLHDDTNLDLEIVLGTGLGYFDLRGLSLTALVVEVGTGEATIDLRGDWARNLAVEVEGGIGKTTMLLPDDTAVRVEVDQMMGGINVEGLEKVDDFYVNTVYAEGVDDGLAVTLDIEVNVGTGELNLVVLGAKEEWTEAQDGEETQ